MRLDRLLSIVVALLNKEKVFAKDLAAKHEVSIRTIYRDIEAINQAGIPIVTNPGNNGGISILKNYKIDKHVLTLKDINSILAALKGVSTTLEHHELDSVYNKIYNLTDKKQNDIEQIEIDLLPWGDNENYKKKVKIIYKAIANLQLLNFSYSKPSAKKLKRTIEPMTLFYKGSAWYLAGYCHKRQDFRLFKISRISELKILQNKFKRRPFSKDMIKNNQPLPMLKMVLKFKPKIQNLVEEYYNPSQIKKVQDGSLIVTVSMPENDWLYGFILSYGEYVEVLKPQSLRKIIIQKTKKISNIYN